MHKANLNNSYASGHSYDLDLDNATVKFNKQTNEILFDLSKGVKVIDNTIMKTLGGTLNIPLFAMDKTPNTNYNPSGSGSSDNCWPPTISGGSSGLIVNADKYYQIYVLDSRYYKNNNEVPAYFFYLHLWTYNTIKNYVDNGSTFKGTKVINIPFKITGI